MSGRPAPPEALALLESSGALQSGHFRLSSGAHSERYVQCSRALQRPAAAEALGAGIGALFRDENATLVAAPALGGVIIGHEVARALGLRFAFAERQAESFVFRRGFQIGAGDRVLLVEDVLTTGGSVMELKRLVESLGGEPIGIGAIVDRTGGRFAPGVAVRTLLSLEIPHYSAEECPLCARGLPLEKPGSRPG